MKKHSNTIKTIRKALHVYFMIGTATSEIDVEEIKAAQKEIESILQIDPMAEFNEAIKVLEAVDRLKQVNCSPKEREEAMNVIAQYRDEKEQPAEKRVDPDSAILNYYERQMAEPEPSKKRGKRGL